ncbi:protein DETOXIFICATION 13 isoform X1 [Arachis hypogaea]|uniref:protein DETOXIFICATION 13 isoform X1 n=1 Tax=Arachis hypogaea TaxID=3818 RepID=UPI003B21BF9D
MKFSTQCEMTCAPISMELFHDFGEFLCYTVPSAGMIYLEWWSFELLTLPSELLPNPELEVSFLSIWMATEEGKGKASQWGNRRVNLHNIWRKASVVAARPFAHLSMHRGRCNL